MSDAVALRAQIAAVRPRSHADFEIRLLMDYGTKTLCIGYQLVQKAGGPVPSNTNILQLQGRPNGECPQIIGFIRQSARQQFSIDNFKYGHELTALLNDNQTPVPESNLCVVERLKIAIFPTENTKEAQQTINRTLERLAIPDMTVVKLLTIHLRAIRKDAQEALIRAYGHLWTPDELNAMQVRTYYTVPEMVKEGSVRVISEAMGAAGYGETTPLSEGESCGAWASYKLHSDRQRFGAISMQSSPDDELLVADGGGLTLNVSSYHFLGLGESETDVQVTPTLRKYGAACGSEIITLKFIEFIKAHCRQQHESIDEYAMTLGYSPEAFERRLSGSFESYKVWFDNDPADRWIVVSSKLQGVTDATFLITRGDMERWFDEALLDIRSIIDKVRTDQTKMILLSGGFFRSMYLVERLKRHYERFNIHMPDIGSRQFAQSDPSVVRGGMIRSTLPEQPIRPDFCIGFAQSEIYDEKVHTDIPPGSDLIKYCPYTGDFYVEDRWCTLLKPGELAKTRRWKSTDIYQLFQLSMEENFLFKSAYVTYGNIQNGDAMIVDFADGTWAVRGDLEEWGDESKQYIRKELLARYNKGWATPDDAKDDGIRYEVWARLKLRRSGPNKRDVQLEWDIAIPEFEPYRNDPNNFQAPRRRELLKLGRSSLYDGNHSSFIRRNTNVRAKKPARAPRRNGRSNLDPQRHIATSSTGELAVPETSHVRNQTPIIQRQSNTPLTRSSAAIENVELCVADSLPPPASTYNSHPASSDYGQLPSSLELPELFGTPLTFESKDKGKRPANSGWGTPINGSSFISQRFATQLPRDECVSQQLRSKKGRLA